MAEGRIFIVDDTFDLVHEYSPLLKESGYRVRSARSAKAAMAGIRRWPPDTILIDAKTPSLDGIALTRRLRATEAFGSIPIVLITISACPTRVVDGLDAGADEFLRHPVCGNELLARIRSMIRLKASSDRLRQANAELKALVERQCNCLQEATRFDTLGRMAGRIGHDLNGLLTGIIGYNDLAIKGDPNKKGRYLQNQRASIVMCQSLAAQLVNFTRCQHPHRAAFAPAAAIDTVLAILAHRFESQGIEAIACVDSSLTIWGDEGQFSQVCLNLLSNACDAMPRGGRLTVDARGGGGWTSIVIADTGHGIAPEDAERVFDLAFTTRDGGSGIGLSTAREIVQQHGGVMAFDSVPGQGTAFTLRLPESRETAEAAGADVCPPADVSASADVPGGEGV